MNFGPEGKLAFVGGANRAIGKAIALELAREGVGVWLAWGLHIRPGKCRIDCEKPQSHGLVFPASPNSGFDDGSFR